MNKMKIRLDDVYIRETVVSDMSKIKEVERLAFGYEKEADLAEALLNDTTAEPRLSLLAFYKDEAIGHILFTRAYLEGIQERSFVHILAPLAVKPDYHGQGVGGLLIRTGLQMLLERGSLLVFVLGHKEYYPRYGFEPNAQGRGFFTPYPDPMPSEYVDYWMVQYLTPDGASVKGGKVVCAEALNQPEHWRQ